MKNEMGTKEYTRVIQGLYWGYYNKLQIYRAAVEFWACLGFWASSSSLNFLKSIKEARQMDKMLCRPLIHKPPSLIGIRIEILI